MMLPIPNLRLAVPRCACERPRRSVDGRCKLCGGQVLREPEPIALPFSETWWPYTEEENAALPISELADAPPADRAPVLMGTSDCQIVRSRGPGGSCDAPVYCGRRSMTASPAYGTPLQASTLPSDTTHSSKPAPRRNTAVPE